MRKTNAKGRGFLCMLGICVIFMIAGILFGTKGNDVRDSSLTELQDRINALNADIAAQQAANDMADTRVVYESTGVDVTKLETDKQAMEQFCRIAFSWDTYDKYQKARSNMQELYGIKEDSYFMTTFFPEVGTSVDMDGNETNDIDRLGINSYFESMDVYLNGMLGDEYSYIIFVKFSSQSQNFYESVSDAVIFATLDSGSSIKNVSAFVAY